jgi:hypothetical protein
MKASDFTTATAWHGGSGQKVGVGSMQLSSPPVMDFNSFLLSFLPACSSKFFMFLIFSELVLTNVIKINEYITLCGENNKYINN